MALGLSFEASVLGQLANDPRLLKGREGVPVARAPSQTLGREREGMHMHAFHWAKANIVLVKDRNTVAVRPQFLGDQTNYELDLTMGAQ